MADIVNKPSWSESRVKTARECLYRYYLTYYLSWGGWERGASQESQQAYMMKKMTNLPMWAGSIVHDIIQKALTFRKSTDGSAIMPLATAEEEATQMLRRGWIDSTQKRWQKGPSKAINLAEHYYDMPLDAKATDGLKLKVLRCLRALYASPIFERINSVPVSQWVTLEEFQAFSLNTGEDVAVKIDFGFRSEGKVYLTDWKTGRASEAVIDQLVTYAMYALKMGWAVRPEDIVIVPVYLDAADKSKMAPELAVTMANMARQANTIRTEFPIIRDLHLQSGDCKRFPRTDDERACKFCSFRGMCPGAQKEIPDGTTPF